MESKNQLRPCGREDCSQCPRRHLGRCHATQEQIDNRQCSCGKFREQEQNQ